MKPFIAGLLIAWTLISPAPALATPVFTKEKLIVVDTAKQLLTAWQDSKIVYQTKVSTGLRQSPTVLGSFRIYQKLAKDDMRGVSPVWGKYFLKNVPNVMYFYGGYAVHGAYWHNNFGYRMSNGCVNVPLASAEWLYNWADVGTRVETF